MFNLRVLITTLEENTLSYEPAPLCWTTVFSLQLIEKEMLNDKLSECNTPKVKASSIPKVLSLGNAFID